MRRETRPFVGLEHVIAEGVRLGHREVGLDHPGGVVHILIFRIGWTILRWTTSVQVRGVHLATVACGIVAADVKKRRVRVVQVVVRDQRDRRNWHHRSRRG